MHRITEFTVRGMKSTYPILTKCDKTSVILFFKFGVWWRTRIFEKKLKKLFFFTPSKNLEGLTVHAWTALFVDDLNLRITVSAIIAFWKKPRSRLFHKEVMKFVLHRQMTI